MKITVLSEDTPGGNDCECEHGLSLFIETAAHKILFDTGGGDLFYQNALKKGIDLSEAEFGVLSHGHYDHGGGLARFFEINEKAVFYAAERAFGDYYGTNGRYIGLDRSLRNNPRIVFVKDKAELPCGAKLHVGAAKADSEIPADPDMKECRNGKFYPDEFAHEQYLSMLEGGKKILFSGCSHGGIANISARFRPDVVVGGFHCSKFSEENLAKLAQKLVDSDCEFYTCHCTGVKSFAFLREKARQILGRFPDKWHYLHCGDEFEI